MSLTRLRASQVIHKTDSNILGRVPKRCSPSKTQAIALGCGKGRQEQVPWERALVNGKARKVSTNTTRSEPPDAAALTELSFQYENHKSDFYTGFRSLSDFIFPFLGLWSSG